MAPKPGGDLGVIFDEIGKLREDVQRQTAELRVECRHDVDQLNSRVTELAVHGCAKAEGHEDHEKRLRALATFRDRQVGAVVAMGGVSGIGGAVLAFLGRAALNMMRGGNAP